jgi:hypothetical protein
VRNGKAHRSSGRSARARRFCESVPPNGRPARPPTRANVLSARR